MECGKQSIPCDDGDSAVSCMVRMHRTLRRRTNETEISACRPMGPRGSGRTLSPTHSSLLLASEYELVEKNDCTFTYLLTYLQSSSNGFTPNYAKMKLAESDLRRGRGIKWVYIGSGKETGLLHDVGVRSAIAEFLVNAVQLHTTEGVSCGK